MEPHISPGTLIAGRYRIERPAWPSDAAPVWHGRDTVLERPVLIQTFPGADPATAERIARAAARAAQISHPALAQIYDVGAEPVAIVVEHAPGGRLADRTRDAALPASQAARVVLQLAAALGALHERGLVHGSVGPATVLFDEESRCKLAGAGLAAELGSALDPPDGYRPPEPGASVEERDRYGLAAVAYRLFTGRAPGGDAPPARAARRGVPAEVERLLARGLGRDPAQRPSLEEFRHALSPLAAAEPPEREPGFFRQEARWLVPVLALVGLGVAAVLVGLRVDFGGGGFPIKIRRGETPAPEASAPFAVASVEDFDPEGNGEEHSAQARLAIDGRETAWTTVGYAGPNLDGRKSGVGLLFDLGRPREVRRIEVRTPLPGWTAEWRTADAKGRAAGDFRPVATFTAGGGRVGLDPPVGARYWLLWITRLVDNGSGANFPFQAAVGEVLFLPR